MAIDKEIKFKGTKAYQYNANDNTWYISKNIRPLWWLNIDDNLSIQNNLTVPLNEYYFGNAGTEIIQIKTIITNRILVPSTSNMTIGNPNIPCIWHTLVLGDIISISVTNAGFTANSSYYVTSVNPGVSFQLSSSYTNTSRVINPTSATIGLFYKKQGIAISNAYITEGYRSLTFDHGNHIQGSYLSGTIPNNKILTQWGVHMFIKPWTTNQPFPVGIAPERTIFHIKDSVSGKYIRIFISTTNLMSVDINGNLLNLVKDLFASNSSTAGYVVAKYDGTNLTLRSSSLFSTHFSETLSIPGLTWEFNSTNTIISIGAKTDGTTALSKINIDSFRFYDRYLTDEEEVVLYGKNYGNVFSSFTSTAMYMDYFKWRCEETNDTQPMQQTGFNGTITPDNGTVNLIRNATGTGVLINQLNEKNICYEFNELYKGYLSSTITIPNLNANSAISIGMWFKDTSTTIDNRRWITNSTLNSGIGLKIFSLGQSSTGQNIIRFNSNNIEKLITTTDWRNVWNYWTIVFDCYKNIVFLYKNGILLDSITPTIYTPVAGLFIGGKNITTNTEYINGYIRDISIKQYRVSVGEMKLTYNNGHPLQT